MKKLFENAKARKEQLHVALHFPSTPSASVNSTMLVRRHEDHVTQSITKIKTTITSTIQLASRIFPTRRRVPKQVGRSMAVRSTSPIHRLVNKVSKTTAAACRTLTTALRVPEAMAKPLARFTSLAHKYVFSKIPSFKVLDKLQKFAKMFFSRGMTSALRSERAMQLVERFVRGWVDRAKCRIELRHYKAAVHAAATDKVMRLLDTTTAHVASNLHRAWHIKQTQYARVIQHNYRHAASRWALEAQDRSAAAQFLRDVGPEHRRKNSSYLDKLMLCHAKERELLVSTLKRVWAREDFTPNVPRSHRLHHDARPPRGLAPLSPVMPPHIHGVRKMGIKKWHRLKEHVNPKQCWVAIPINVHAQDNSSPQRTPTLLPLRHPSHYRLDYDWIPGTLIHDPPKPPPTFEEKLNAFEQARVFKSKAIHSTTQRARRSSGTLTGPRTSMPLR
ncbi:hypothetical protein H310_10000 [Aphanomyces invadans]|uniref:Uncharacterized protein n=1 Tax=Aphanomyces invadans TaxID=157072 RepID=A0A024TT49_9STRA|nr:hypothetical protein H310_10000 [Aphanomyces invadans]ETV97213.1 hypothetical protein H310_10000 [Aphanomyces invadans]|eukprot:XP_008874459.1 hypothetical protein H310_10000 [Aphanomyces invadans]